MAHVTEHNIYEVSVTCEDDRYSYRVEHRFPTLPERETLVMLKTEAANTFLCLHDVEPDQVCVYVMYLSAAERDPQPDHAETPTT